MKLDKKQQKQLQTKLRAKEGRLGERSIIGPKTKPDSKGISASMGQLRTAYHALFENDSRKSWLNKNASKAEMAEGTVLAHLLDKSSDFGRAAYFRQGRSSRQGDLENEILTVVWTAVVREKERSIKNKKAITVDAAREILSNEFLDYVAGLSVRHDGPKAAIAELRNSGISFVFLSGPSGLNVDGMSFSGSIAEPVIALSLRHDRLDNFWFTLFHELAHIKRHIGLQYKEIVDDLDEESYDIVEREADRVASDVLIPRALWRRTRAYKIGEDENILRLAERINRHPSIIAGRIRGETKNYALYANMVGQGEVRKLFL